MYKVSKRTIPGAGLILIMLILGASRTDCAPQSTSRPSKTASSSRPVASTIEWPQVGDSRDDVLRKLGDFDSQIITGEVETLYYDRRNGHSLVIILDMDSGRVIQIHKVLISETPGIKIPLRPSKDIPATQPGKLRVVTPTTTRIE